MTAFLALTAAIVAVMQLPHVSAVPNVTVIPLLMNSCSSWPGWIRTRDADVTYPLQIEVDQADDEAINGLLTDDRTYNGSDGIVHDVVISLRKSRRFAKVPFRCYGGTLQLGIGMNPAVINIGKDNRRAFLTFGDGYKPQPYAHEINGVRQPGVFLGVKNQTTWGFSYVLPEVCNQLDHYEVKLQGLPLDPTVEPRAARPPEFFGFLKVVPYV